MYDRLDTNFPRHKITTTSCQLHADQNCYLWFKPAAVQKAGNKLKAQDT